MSNNNNATVKIKDLMLIKDTGNAILVRCPSSKREEWIPKSQISYQLNMNDILDIEIPEWLAKSKGLDYE